MTTVTIWLLLNIGGTQGMAMVPTVPIERFATVDECQRVLRVIQETGYNARLRCVQATVLRP